MIKACFSLLMMTTGALAQVIPNDEDKAWALKRAYEINGNSMIGCVQEKCHMIDVSQELAENKAGVVDPKEKNSLDAIADTTNPDPAPKKKKSIRHNEKK